MYMKSRYSRSRFFTPPKIEPLGLDVEVLDGGGSCPAQFWGRTHDGEEVFCHYRGGHLEVKINSQTILAARIGPPLHGVMTREQLCHCAGITISGQQLPLRSHDDLDREGASDFSGATSYFDVWVESTTSTQKRLLALLQGRLADCAIVQPRFDSNFEVIEHIGCTTIDELEQDFFSIVLNSQLSSDTLTLWKGRTKLAEIDPNAFELRVCASGFRFPLTKYADIFVSWVRDTWGKSVQVAGIGEDMLHGSFSLHARFPTHDIGRRQLLYEISDIFDEVYPTFRITESDVVTEEKVREPDYIGHFDPAIVEWIEGDQDRWYSVFPREVGAEKRAIGQRLVRVEPPAEE